MLSFLSQVLDAILITLGLASPETVRRKELRKIRTGLKVSASQIYRVQGNLLLPGFASAVLELRRLLLPFHEILKGTLDEYSNPAADRCWDYLIESKFDAKIGSRRERFTFESALEQIHGSDDIESGIQTLTREFNAYIAALSTPEYDKIEDDLMDIRRLISLCRHPYERLLRHFTTSLNFDDPSWKPQFVPASAEKVVPDLHDFYFILQNFTASPSIANDIAMLAFRGREGTDEAETTAEVDPGMENETVPGEDDGVDHDRSALERNLTHLLERIEKLIRGQFNPDLLADILKSAQNDSTFLPRVDEERIPSMKSYRNRQEDQFMKTIDHLRREWKDSSVYKGIQSLFGTGELLPLKNFSENESRLVEEDGLGFFTNIMPLRILKSFIVGKYEKNIRETISRLTVEGFFQTKSLQEDFTHTVGECEKSLTTLTSFEDELNDDGSYSLKALETVRTQTRQKGHEAVAQKIIEGINRKSRTLLESQVHIFTRLTLYLEDFLQDAKSRNPERVINLRTIGGASNVHFITALKTGCAELTEFLRLMKHFTYVDDRIFSHAHVGVKI